MDDGLEYQWGVTLQLTGKEKEVGVLVTFEHVQLLQIILDIQGEDVA